MVDGDYVHSPVAGNEPAVHYINSQYVQPYSSYSSLNGWAGDCLAKCPTNNYSSPYGPYVVTPQSPGVYDSERVMQDAFEAASFAHLDVVDHSSATSYIGYSYARSDNLQCLQEYERGIQDINRCHGDHRQLFNHSPLSAY